jgi:hypothetical protein
MYDPIEAMTMESLKLELIQWILCLQDLQILSKVHKIKENEEEISLAVKPRQFGCGKGIFTYIADDFDAIPPGFEDYSSPKSVVN